MGAIASDQLLDTLGARLGLLIIDIEQEIQQTVPGLLPRHIYRECGALPLILDGDTVLRVRDGHSFGHGYADRPYQ